MKGVIAISQRDEPRMKRRASNTEGKNALTSSSDRNRHHRRMGVAGAYPFLGRRELVEVVQGGKGCRLDPSCSVSGPS
jgi:hypothetical protein